MPWRAESATSPYADQALAYAGRSFLDAGQTAEAIELLKTSSQTDSPYALESAHLLAGIWLKQKKFTDVLALVDPRVGKTEDEARDAIHTSLDQPQRRGQR